jgi:deoxycytidine triphosphate deaminase
MSVIDLSRRVTDSREDFDRNKKSYESLIFVSSPALLDESKVSFDLSVGVKWYDHRSQRYYSIDESGLHVPPKSSVVIITEQRVALPTNVFGLVMGKGKYIYREAIVSPGKIDPGFDDFLRIAFYNASSNTICLKKGEPFCSCCFMTLESTVAVSPRNELGPQWPVGGAPWGVVLRSWLARYWDKAVPIFISGVSLLVALATFYLTQIRAGR